MGVWMMHPIELNALSKKRFFPNTWVKGGARDNFRMAFHPPEQREELYRLPVDDKRCLAPTDLPLAVQASAVDPRVVVQRSCFTVHGKDQLDLEVIAAQKKLHEAGFFKKYKMPRSCAPALREQLEEMGTSYTSIYPDLAGLAKELRLRFSGVPPQHKFCKKCGERRQLDAQQK